MNKAVVEISPAILDVYRKLVADYPGLSLKGLSMPYTSLNGNMFSFVTNEGKLALWLPGGDCQEIVEKYQTGPVIQHGARMKEYVEVPETLQNDLEELKKYFNRSFQYAALLKPKQVKANRKSSISGG